MVEFFAGIVIGAAPFLMLLRLLDDLRVVRIGDVDHVLAGFRSGQCKTIPLSGKYVALLAIADLLIHSRASP